MDQQRRDTHDGGPPEVTNMTNRRKVCILRAVDWGGACLHKLGPAEVEHELRVEGHVLGEGE